MMHTPQTFRDASTRRSDAPPAIERRDKERRDKERGAALITVLMISMLLLTAGVVLVLTTAMGGTNTVDATAEMQAYYGAEAGLQATLNVLRNRVPPATPLASPLPSPDLINFRVAVDPTNSNKPGDAASSGANPTARLSRWLQYSATYTDRVPLTPASYSPFNGAAYSVALTDPDDPTGATRASNASYLPSRLLVTVNGYGPRSARKQLQLMVTTMSLDFTAQAMMALIGSNTPSDSMILDLGPSAAHTYSGHDNSNAAASPLSAFAVTNALDKGILDTAVAGAKSGTVALPGATLVTDPNTLPWYLRTADNARAFLAIWRDKAINGDNGKYYGSGLSGVAGTNSHSFTFVDGDCNLTGGSGLLIVTGELITKGNPSFSGLILVLGKGKITRSGGGSGNTFGALVVAAFGATGGFTHPSYTISGGGNMTMQYDKAAVDAARAVGKEMLGVVEN
jgi:Tfp pilus assembly protein PilX